MYRAAALLAAAIALIACGKKASKSADEAARCAPTVAIEVDYPGASPAEVEALVRSIEEAAAPLARELSSEAREGHGRVVVRPRGSVDEARAALRERLASLSGLPVDAERPVVVVPRAAPGELIAIAGDLGDEELQLLAARLRDQLSAADGVRQVTRLHAPEHELRIEVDLAHLASRGLTVDQVVGAVRSASVDLPGGSARTAGGTVLLRTADSHPPDVGDIQVVTAPAGVPVRIADIARVTDRLAGGTRVSLDGRPAALLLVEPGPVDLAALSLPPAVSATSLGEVKGCDDLLAPERARLRIEIDLPAGARPRQVDSLAARARGTLSDQLPDGAALLELVGAGADERIQLMVIADGPAPDAAGAADDLSQQLVGASVLVTGDGRTHRRVRLVGDDLDQLDRAAADLGSALAARGPIGWRADTETAPELTVRVTDAGRALGLTPQAVAEVVRVHEGGVIAAVTRRGAGEQRVVVSAAGDLENAQLVTPAGETVLLNQIAELHRSRQPRAIHRVDRRRVAYIDLAAPAGTDLAAHVAAAAAAVGKRYPDLRIELTPTR